MILIERVGQVLNGLFVKWHNVWLICTNLHLYAIFQKLDGRSFQAKIVTYFGANNWGGQKIISLLLLTYFGLTSVANGKHDRMVRGCELSYIA